MFLRETSIGSPFVIGLSTTALVESTMVHSVLVLTRLKRCRGERVKVIQLSVVIGQEEMLMANVRVTCTNTLMACTRSHCHSAPLTSSYLTLRAACSGAGA